MRTKIKKKRTINRGLLPKVGLVSSIQYGGQLRKLTEEAKLLAAHAQVMK